MEDKIKIKLKLLRDSLIVITFITGLLTIVFIGKLNTCKQVVIYINSKALCQMHGINKNKCKIKADYCGEKDGFYRIKINKNGKTEEEYINKNAVDLITFKNKGK